MRSSIISAWLVLLSATACISQVNDYNLLEDAIVKDDVNLLKQLLNNGTNAKAANKDGWTALIKAASDGTEKMVELLIPVSDVKATIKYGYSALMFATRYGTEKMVELLIPVS